MSFLNRIFANGAKQDPRSAQKETLEFAPEKVRPEFDAENNCYRLRFGKAPDDYFICDSNKKIDAIMYSRLLNHVLQDDVTAQVIKGCPVEKRPILIRMEKDLFGGAAGWCSEGNPGQIAMNPLFGTGYEAASTFVHEFHHHQQHMDLEGYEEKFKSLNTQEESTESRISEATAETAGQGYTYRMRNIAPFAFAKSLAESPCLRAIVKAKREGKSDEETNIAGIVGYCSDISTAAWYEKNYKIAASAKAHTEVLDTRRYGTEELKKVNATRSGWLVSDIEGEEKLDYAAALKHHGRGLFKTQEGLEKATKIAQTADVTYITPKTARVLQMAAEVMKGNGKSVSLAHINVRSTLGRFSLDEKTKPSLAKIWSDAKRSVKQAFTPAPQKKYIDFGYYNKGMQYITLTGERNQDAKGPGIIKFEKLSGERMTTEESDKNREKASAMFAILMKDPSMRSTLMQFGEDKNMTLVFDSQIKGGHTTPDNRIIMNPKGSAFEMAAEFAKQLQKVQQNEASKEFANGDIKAYNTEKNMMRNPVQSMLEDKMREAAADAAKARFIVLNKDQMSLADKIAAKTNPMVKAYEKALDKFGNHMTASVAAMETSAKRNKQENCSNKFSFAYDRLKKLFDKGETDKLPPSVVAKGKEGAMQEMFTKTVENSQIAQVACAGFLNDRAIQYVADVSMKKPQVNFMTEENVADMLKMKGMKKKDGLDPQSIKLDTSVKTSDGLYFKGIKIEDERPLTNVNKPVKQSLQSSLAKQAPEKQKSPGLQSTLRQITPNAQNRRADNNEQSVKKAAIQLHSSEKTM